MTVQIRFLAVLFSIAMGAGASSSAQTAASADGMDTLISFGEVMAVEASRVGSPPNPDVFLPGVTSPPVLGQTWDPVIDHTEFVPDAGSDFLILTPSPANLDLGLPGTLLCGSPVLAMLVPAIAPGAPFPVSIPDDIHLAGLELCAQAGSSTDGVTFRLTNALDITIGTH